MHFTTLHLHTKAGCYKVYQFDYKNCTSPGASAWARQPSDGPGLGHNIITWLAVMHLVSRQLGQQEQKELKLRNTLEGFLQP